MKIKSLSIFIASTILICSTVIDAFGQGDIQQQFDEFYKTKTTSWEEYKLIKKPLLRSFWSVVSDTLDAKQDMILSTKRMVKSLRSELDSINFILDNTAVALSESEAVNDKISFLGFEMNKILYNMLVWALIFGLLFAISTCYMMYMRSNAVTNKVQKAYSNLESEFNEHKNRARENQVKLKRELQTALNTLHDSRMNM